MHTRRIGRGRAPPHCGALPAFDAGACSFPKWGEGSSSEPAAPPPPPRTPNDFRQFRILAGNEGAEDAEKSFCSGGEHEINFFFAPCAYHQNTQNFIEKLNAHENNEDSDPPPRPQGCIRTGGGGLTPPPLDPDFSVGNNDISERKC